MEYQKIINLLDDTIKHLNLRQEIGLKQMMNHKECIRSVIKLNLKLNDKVRFM